MSIIFILILFLVLILLGTPIVFSLGVTSLLFFILDATPLSIISQRIFGGLDSFTIMAIPFFVLTGIIMERGGIARRIIDFSNALIGWATGGLLMTSVVAGTGMAAISGSGSADTAAISTIMLPEMKKRKYDIDFAASILAAAGSLGPILPPSIMMVVLASIANLSVGKMFLAGIIPGLLIAFALLVCCYVHAIKKKEIYNSVENDFSFKKLKTTFIAAIPALLLPMIIIGGILSGYFTPTEAAAIAVLVGILVSYFWYKELKLKDLKPIIYRAACISSTVMLVIAMASIFAYLISVNDIPKIIGDYLKNFTDNPFIFILIVNILLLLVGMFLESISAILILTPILIPLAVTFGINPLHMGVIIVMNLSIGMITPPYGITLFVASSIAQRTIVQVSRKIIAPLSLMIFVLLVTSYFPMITLYLPSIFLS